MPKQSTRPKTELYYFRARFYHAQLGRFISRDPLGYVDGMSLYRAYFVPGGMDPFGLRLDDVYHWDSMGPIYFSGGVCYRTRIDQNGNEFSVPVDCPTSPTGIPVPGSEDERTNCLGVACGTGGWKQWPDTYGFQLPCRKENWQQATTFVPTGCYEIECGEKCAHFCDREIMVFHWLVGYKATGRNFCIYHILGRPQGENCWTSKIGKGKVYCGITDPHAHTFEHYSETIEGDFTLKKTNKRCFCCETEDMKFLPYGGGRDGDEAIF